MKKRSKQIAVIACMCAFGLMALGSTESEVSTGNVDTEAVESTATNDAEEKEDTTEATKGDVTEAVEDETTEEMTMGQKNALKQADNYLNVLAFSYTGLIKQLEFDGYSTEDATYAADNCGADWNEQAAKQAKSYLDVMSFSRQGLIDQLEYDGFTQEQAEYGVSAVGY